jgi:hypothetical protein
MPVNYDAIPEQLRWDINWCVAGPDENDKHKAPYILQGRKLYRASPVNPAHWRDLETTIEAAQSCPPCGIGYVLTRDCGYTVIDLDVKNQHNYPDDPSVWSTQEQLDRFWKIVQYFDSYTERSASGQGLHIWVKGDIGPGIKARDGVEVYSRERFIVTTGDVLIDKPIEERQDQLNVLVAEMRAQTGTIEKLELEELDPTESDEDILARAYAADNADKFVALMNATADIGKGDKKIKGNYVELGYPSQSEADLALMSIFTFYSKSNEQCRRLFRLSNLARRQKATKDDIYLNYTLRLIRTRQANDDLAQEHGAQLAAALMQTIAAQAEQAQSSTHAQPEQVQSTAPAAPSSATELPWPPGFVGYLAQYIYENAPRPVREVAIVAALGLAAGICGKAYCVPQSGLNLYIVLIARSGVGKEAMHSGIAAIVQALSEVSPEVSKFVDFTEYASGPALSKAVTLNPCFVNVSGEWGRRLKRLAQEDGRDGPMQQLRTVMTNLYQKSGPQSIVGGIGYSNKENNVASVSGAAYSMIGETTPGTFYEALTENMMEDGFLSRFTIVEYPGERPELNPKRAEAPGKMLVDHLAGVVGHADELIRNNKFIEVQRTREAYELLHSFNLECDNNIFGVDDESKRQMYNRAHLKALRISGLMASVDNHMNPVIVREHAEWAIDLVRRDIAIMRKRMVEGDVGVGDGSRERKVMALLKKYLQMQTVAISYKIPPQMHKDGVIPRSYIQLNVQKVSSFTNHRGGANVALDATIRAMMDNGYLQEVPKDKLTKDYGFAGRCFRILNIVDSL